MTEEPRELSPEEYNKALLMQLVVMLSTSAMQQMGKLVNPAAGKTEMNLDAAGATIDLVAMLQAKTKGNVDKDEAAILRDSIGSLQRTYWETKEAAGKSGAGSPKEEPQKSAPTAEPAPPKGGDGKEPKFHKKYE
jgi:hypothetical protein